MYDEIKKRIKELDKTMPDNLVNALFIQDSVNFFASNVYNVLRHMAVHYLEHGNGLVAESFRGEYANVNSNSYTDFLQHQGKNGVWMTDIELIALGELFGFSIVVTSSMSGLPAKKFSLYNAGSQSTVLHFKNINNVHWEYINLKNEVVKTKGDGNCGYHAFSAGLKDLASSPFLLQQKATTSPKTQTTEEKTVKQEDKNDDKKNDPIATTINQSTVETSRSISYLQTKQISKKEEIIAIKKQQEILHKIVKTIPTANELEQMQKQEAKRIATLPQTEQQQIATDYLFALKLAMEDNPKYLRKIINKPNYLTSKELHKIRTEDNRFNLKNYAI